MKKGIVITSLYTGVQILSDILSLRILYIFGMSVDGGTLIYPLTFTIRDLLHRTIGKSLVKFVIFTSAFINLLMVFLFWLVSILPPDMSVGLQSDFGKVLLPFWRITVASVIAEVFSELLDGEMYEVWVKKFGDNLVLGRVLFSNFFSIILDSFLFTSMAFLGMLPVEVVISIFFSNVLIKFILSGVSSPLIYLTNDK